MRRAAATTGSHLPEGDRLRDVISDCERLVAGTARAGGAP